jgi:hypothetical protein
MQINRRGDLSARRGDIHAGACGRIQHPGRQNSDHAERRLTNPATGALLTALLSNTAPIQWMPTVMDLDFLPDMGRMNGRLPIVGPLGYYSRDHSKRLRGAYLRQEKSPGRRMRAWQARRPKNVALGRLKTARHEYSGGPKEELPVEAPFFATRSPVLEKYSTGRDKMLVDLIRRVDDPPHGVRKGEEGNDCTPGPAPALGAPSRGAVRRNVRSD